MIVHKKPMFENDSYMFVINTQTDKLQEISLFDLEYYNAKRNMFMFQFIQKHHLSEFCFRPSLRDFDNIKDLSGTIYTHTCAEKNGLDYSSILHQTSKMYKKSRRCAINFADRFVDYMDDSKNTSCLNSIHFYNYNVTLYFRASDIKNELLIDLHLIKEFFIDKVGEFKTITVMASTSQNIDYFETLIN